VEGLVEFAPGGAAGAGDDISGLAVADEHDVAAARQFASLHDAVWGENRRAAGDVEAGFDDAVVTEADPDAAVCAEEAALADRDLFLAPTGQRALD
jgi:hypothetical protein